MTAKKKKKKSGTRHTMGFMNKATGSTNNAFVVANNLIQIAEETRTTTFRKIADITNTVSNIKATVKIAFVILLLGP